VIAAGRKPVKIFPIGNFRAEMERFNRKNYRPGILLVFLSAYPHKITER